MWIDAQGVRAVLQISLTYAYRVIHDLKDELEEKGYYNNPTKKVPVAYFCERFGLDEDEVRTFLKEHCKTSKEEVYVG